MRTGLARVAGLAIAVMLLAVSTSASAQQGPFTMKIGTPTLNDSQHEYLKRFAAAVEKASQGRIKPEIYPASQLGSIPRQIEATQLGSQQVFAAPPEFFDGVDPRFQVLTAPGLFDDMDHADRVQKDAVFRKLFFALGLNRGLRLVALFEVGPSGFTTRVPVTKLADLKGLKLRVLASPLQLEPLRKLGATGVPMSLGDVMPAIQQGTIDGALGAIPVFASLRFYDASKYFTETNFLLSSSIVVVSKAWLDKLPSDLQQLIVETGIRLGDEMHPYVKTFYEASKKDWVAHGGTILQIPADERASAMAEQAVVAREVIAKDGRLGDIYKALVEATERTRQK